MEQQTDEWFAARLGKVTASRVSDVVVATTSGWGASRTNYAAQLIAERLTGAKEESFQSAAMLRGSEIEDSARRAYEFIHDTTIEQVGFINHPLIEMSGASPDGLIGKDGMIEIKCPNTATHIATLQGRSIKKVYRDQMQWQMACTERDWCDFVSFDPRMPPAMQLHIVRIPFDRPYVAELHDHIKVFLADIETTVSDLISKYDSSKAAA